MASEDEVQTIFNFLLTQGAIELTGMSAWGEPTYRVTEKCEEIFPEFYRVHRAELNNTAYSLWSKGVIDISFDEEDERIIFNKSHYERLKECADELNNEEIELLISMGAPLTITVEDEEV